MSNPYFVASGQPATGAFAASAPMRTEFSSIEDGFDLMPALTASTAVVVNSAGTALGNTVGTLALAGNFATTGAFAVTLAASAAVTLTLPAVSGTLATLAGTETFSNKTFGSNVALGTPVSGIATNLTGTAAGLTAGNVTTNANLTGPITSSGNATAVAAQTGTGSTFVMNTSPTLVTPVLGVATATSINKVAITAPASSATLTIGDGATLAVTAGKTVTLSNTLTLTATDGSTLAIGTGGTLTSAAFTSIGTSGATIPLLNGTNTWSGANTFQNATTTLGVQSTTQGTLVLGNTASGSKAVTLQSSNSNGAAWTLTLPTSAGTSGYLLSTNGSGVTSWVSPAAGYAEVGTITASGGETTLSLTGLTSSDIIVVFSAITLSSGSGSFTMACSTDGGGSYGTTRTINTIDTTARYGSIALDGVKLGYVTSYVPNDSFTSTAFGSTSVKSSSGASFSYVAWYPGAAVTALQFASAGFGAGTIITLYGR